MSSSYIIQGGEEGRARLSVLSEVMAPHTGALLDRGGPWAGLRVLDAGCGPGEVSRELALRVGPGGSVLGIDGDAVKIAAAREAAAGLSNLGFHVGDAAAPPGDETFDAIYARFLLSHLADVPAMLAAFRKRLKPGGRILVEDVDFCGHFAEPPVKAFEDYVAWYREAAWLRGADAEIGQKLPRLLGEAGFTGLEAGAVNPAALTGPLKSVAPLTLAAIAPSVIDEKIATAAEVEAAIRALRAAADDPAVFMSLPRVVQVVGRAP